MLSYLDPILFPDEVKVYEISLDRYVYPIFKNGSSSIQAMDYRQLNYTEIRNLREIDIFVRDPFERYVSGVQTYLNSMSSQLDRFTMLNIISQYLFLNRHFTPQFFWVLNLARFTDAWMHFLPMTDLVTATEYTFNQLSRDTELEAYFQNHSKLEFYLQLDKAITEEFLGETVSFRRVCEHMRNKQSYLWDEIVVRNQTLCSVLG